MLLNTDFLYPLADAGPWFQKSAASSEELILNYLLNSTSSISVEIEKREIQGTLVATYIKVKESRENDGLKSVRGTQ